MRTEYLGASLIKRKRLNDKKLKKEVKSETYLNNLQSFVESLGLEKSECETNSEKDEVDKKKTIFKNKIIEIVNSYDATQTMPPRVGNHNKLFKYKKIFSMVENTVFNRWIANKTANYIFEHNIEIWRQFWLSVERVETLVQVIDIRNPFLLLQTELFTCYPSKKHIVLFNKCEMLDINPGLYIQNETSYLGSPSFFDKEQKIQKTASVIVSKNDIYKISSYLTRNGIDVYFINESISISSLLNQKYQQGTFAFVGFPNAGKSTTINNILKQKKVKVSKTPGKTKYLQTLHLNEKIIIYDTPGIIFPTPNLYKAHLLLLGVLNINACEIRSVSDQIINLVGPGTLSRHYKVKYCCNECRPASATEFLTYFSDSMNIDAGKALKMILTDFMAGNIKIFNSDSDIWHAHRF